MRVIDFLTETGKKIVSMLLPESAYAYFFGTEDFESCSSLPCSFDTTNTWGSVYPSLDHTSKVNGASSLKEDVSWEGGGSLMKTGLNTGEVWVKLKVWVPADLTCGPSGYFTIVHFDDPNAIKVWLAVEDWGIARLTVNGDSMGYVDTGLDLVKGAVNTIQMRVKMGSTNGDVDLWLNNDTQGSPSYNGSGTMNTGTTNIDMVLTGGCYAPEAISTTYYDDVTIDTHFIGSGGGSTGALQDLSYTYDPVGHNYSTHDTVDLTGYIRHFEHVLATNRLSLAQIALANKYMQQAKFYRRLESFGYKLFIKPVKRYQNAEF